ncbi:EscU/YscU/HrcU family type III secretion system export apparatus switch protein [Aureliella helgolandensis]|uniref:Flagellar biosynthetic protein FlhB n=1 Tax=Aureliella helgolandensis TaxID=2527968 RepID=A0A518GGM2_9BACT|nr:EscU/YscU/HrcU family type III secretion system export apparatus switch protein [Aureliella helgolandensis]QDV27730.1 Flagellar biosynthetic protein FlhB [Aureliella helgolandensis]
MSDSGGDKKHDASPHRRQQAREKGQVARSQDLGSALVLLLAVVLLGWTGPQLLESISDIMTASLTQENYWSLDAHSASGMLTAYTHRCVWSLLPLMSGICGIIIVNNLFQIGFLFLPDKLSLDWKRIDPMSGAKRLVALPNIAKLGFGLMKIALITGVMILGLWSKWDLILGAHAYTAGEIGRLVWTTTLDMCMRTAIVLLLLAVLDYGFQWWKFEQDIKMTDEEVREENKMMNGDPQVMARRRSIQRQMLMNRMSSTVPEADVVVTNPTELAIAIKFDHEKMAAPMVLAKGAGHVAARIRKLALESGVPVLERKPLAQALFKIVDIGETVPVDQYAAVAEVLRYVYQLQGKKLPQMKSAG